MVCKQGVSGCRWAVGYQRILAELYGFQAACVLRQPETENHSPDGWA
ncbi:MAG: hypothetical protein ACFNS8_00340 [Kingella oralis]